MGKDVWYDESLLVPFMIRWPGRIPPRKDDLHFGNPDILPTLLDLMGLSKHIPVGVQGSNYSNTFRAQPDDRPSSAFYFYTAPQLIDRPDRCGVKTDRYTFVVDRNNRSDQLILHSNEQDLYQLENIADREREVVGALIVELNQWHCRTNDPWVLIDQ